MPLFLKTLSRVRTVVVPTAITGQPCVFAFCMREEAEAESVSALSDKHAELTQQLTELEVEGVSVLPDTDEPLPFEDHSFDLIICHQIDTRLAERHDLLEQLRRVLSPDGILAVPLASAQGHVLGALWGERERPRLTYEALYAQLAPKFGGVSAFESLQMYSRTESIPVIFITAYPSAEIKKKVLEMGATDFIAKPFTPEELLPKVKRALTSC